MPEIEAARMSRAGQAIAPKLREQLALPFDAELDEIPTASPWCQRWRNGRPTWRVAYPDERLDPSRYEVHPIDHARAKEYVTTAHYLRTYPAARLRYGLFDAGQLVGVAVFGIPGHTAVLTSAFPGLEPIASSLELSRFVLDDRCPGNSESWFLARCFTELLARGIRGVVSFADPVPRRGKDDVLVAPGHVGWIYQASNAVYTGRGTARTIVVLPDGMTLNGRSLQKVRGTEQGHEYVEKRLIAFGARAPRAGEAPAPWLRQALEDIGARRVRHRGCHRYLFRLGRSRRERERIEIGHTALPYPKRNDARLVGDACPPASPRRAS